MCVCVLAYRCVHICNLYEMDITDKRPWPEKLNITKNVLFFFSSSESPQSSLNGNDSTSWVFVHSFVRFFIFIFLNQKRSMNIYIPYFMLIHLHTHIYIFIYLYSHSIVFDLFHWQWYEWDKPSLGKNWFWNMFSLVC